MHHNFFTKKYKGKGQRRRIKFYYKWLTKQKAKKEKKDARTGKT